MGTIGAIKEGAKKVLSTAGKAVPYLIGVSAGYEVHQRAKEREGPTSSRYGRAAGQTARSYARDLGPYYLAEKAAQTAARGGLGWGLLAADIGLIAAGREPLFESHTLTGGVRRMPDVTLEYKKKRLRKLREREGAVLGQ